MLATPLGNLGDLSGRAIEVLRSVDLVAAEDTRRARKLLSHVGARVRVVSFHAHSPSSRLDQLERALAENAAVALLTDAGTPTVSDPGAALVACARAVGSDVVAIPGPSAVTAALSVSGLPADQYTFLGFLPRKGANRRRRLEEVAASPWTVVLFEAANRLVRLLRDLAESCGHGRGAVVARELTKLHEEVKSGTLLDLAVYYEAHAPRGEVTLVVEGGAPVAAPVDEDAARRRASALLAEGASRKNVASQVAREFAMSRREAYRMVTAL